jgi:serine/threonine protein kinase
MGVVWLADDEKLSRSVALKFLPDILLLDPAARDDLKRETRRSLELTHPHIVRIHDFVEDEEMAAIAMEFVDGPTLSQLRVDRSSRTFEVEDLKVWTAALCTALNYAHETGRCVHRDLKPTNLMVSARGVLKVADFGIACSLHNTAALVSAWSSSGGTLGYMSPQQLLGELASPADDVYSVGATLYELLTGKPPFYTGDLSAQIREVRPETVAKRRGQFGLPGATVPMEWEETIAACLAKQPAERPKSAHEIARRLGLPSGIGTEIAPSLAQESGATICANEKQRPPNSVPFRIKASIQTTAQAVARHRWPIIATICMCIAIWSWLIDRHPAMVAPSPMPRSVIMTFEEPKVALPPGEESRGSIPTSNEILPTPAQIPSSPSDREFLAATQSISFSTSTPAAEPSPGQLEITSIPAGIPFQVLGGSMPALEENVFHRGETPASSLALPVGDYRVLFHPFDQPPHSAVVRIGESSLTKCDHEFPHGTVKITSQPVGAEIFCDERSVGLAPLEVIMLAGKHQIGASWRGRNARVRTLVMKEKARETVAFDFQVASTPRQKSRRAKQPDESMWENIGDSLNKFFTGGKKKPK